MRALIIFAVLLCANGFADDAALQSVYQSMDRAAPQFKGFTANLVKIDHQDFVDATDKSTGTLTVRKAGPRNLQALEKIETQNGKPDVEETGVTGSRVSVYRPKTNVLTEFDVSKKYRGVEEAAFGVFGGSSKDLQQDYQVTYGGPDPVAGQPATRLILKPKDPQLAQMYPKIEIWISDATGIAIQQKIYEVGEKDYHLLTYSDMKLGPISESQVKLNPPKNAKIEHPH
jgi:outer membrane lipoprotein-sorting protein